ncbi:MAG: FeoC-like transcriptional regulator [Desulfatitalea sp.]|nr:FeoC-like transcriptional regulator [Desulfatitalea sp.]
MILSEIKHYLMAHRRATLSDLAVHFDMDPDAMRGMLVQWVRKGRVIQSEIKAGCGKTCSGCCDHSSLEIYEWVA